jgi:outer membrane usher protein
VTLREVPEAARHVSGSPRDRTHSFCLTAALALLSCPSVAVAAPDHAAVLSLQVNGLPKGRVSALLRGRDVLVRVAELQGADVYSFSGDRKPVGGRLYVSLLSLAPGIRFAANETALELTVSPEHLPPGSANPDSGPPKSAVLPPLPATSKAATDQRAVLASPAQPDSETARPESEPPDGPIPLASRWPGKTATDQSAVLALRVNEMPKGDVIALLRGRDVLARVAELQRAGVLGFAGNRETIGEPYVSLLSLAPDVLFQLDERELDLRLTVTPRRLGSTSVDLHAGAPKGMRLSRDSSAFVNYAVSTSNFRGISGFGEAGWNVRGNLLYSGVSVSAGSAFVRGLSNFTIDDPGRLRRWTLGDRFAETGSLGGGAFLGGVSLTRDFDLDPYFVRFPRFGLSGAVSTPSTVDVYVNGTLVRREQLPPGQFDLQNVPVSAGSGSTRLVLRDAFGNERQIASPYYFSTGVLSKGLSDYSYNVGFVRENLATRSADYRDLAFLGRHRVGVTNGLTLGARLEATRDLVGGGPTLTARLPFGEIELSAAASRDKDVTGAAGSFGFTYIGRPVSFGAAVRALTDHYSHTSLRAAQDRAVTELQGFLGTRLTPRVGVSAQYRSSDMRDGGRRAEASLSASAQLTPRSHVFVSASRLQAERGKWTTGFSAGLSYSLGPRATAGLSYRQSDHEGFAVAEVQSPLTRSTGLGYLLQVRNGGGLQSGFARVQYQGAFGRYEAFYSRTGGQNQTSFSATGGFVAIGGSLYATRSVQQSFALIRVPGVGGVRGFSSNQEVGRTSASGDLLVTDLLSYYGNRLSIEDQDIPLDYSIDATEKVIAPPHRGGAIVSFPVRKIQSVTGTLTVREGRIAVVPASGELTVEVGESESASPLGNGGEFYLENVPEGRHPAKVESRGGVCRFVLEVPPSAESFLDLGAVVCKVR